MEEALRAVAVYGKWLCGVGDDQVKLLAAMLHQEMVMIGFASSQR